MIQRGRRRPLPLCIETFVFSYLTTNKLFFVIRYLNKQWKGKLDNKEATFTLDTSNLLICTPSNIEQYDINHMITFPDNLTLKCNELTKNPNIMKHACNFLEALSPSQINSLSLVCY